MKIVIESRKPDIRWVELEGDLDFQSSPELRHRLLKLLEETARKVVVNLEKVDYLDSSGLATFIELFQKMRQKEGELVLCRLSQSVRSVFEIAKLDTIFCLAQDEAEALSVAA